MQKRQKNIMLFIIMSALIFSVFSITVFADTGPKPSVNIEFTNPPQEIFYVTLLSESEGGGPWHYDHENIKEYESIEQNYGIKKEIWDIFLRFEDADGFYLLPYVKECADSFRWGYYPPDTFKVLIYFPERDVFAVSKIYERYAFDSYYEINLDQLYNTDNYISEKGEISVFEIECETVKNYDYKTEIKGFIARIIITLFIEMLIAYIFGYHGKGSFFVLLITNIITQAALNIILNIQSYYHGLSSSYYMYYVLIEIIILAAEAIVYLITLPRINEMTGRIRAILYALTANSASFIIGLWIAKALPEIF